MTSVWSSGTTPVADALLGDVGPQIPARSPASHRYAVSSAASSRLARREFASELTDAPREIDASRHELAVPEGHARRRAGRGHDDDPIVLDRADAPRRRAELKDVANRATRARTLRPARRAACDPGG